MASSLELFRWFGFIEMGLPYCVALALVSSGVSWLRAGRARTLALPDVVLNLSCALMYLIFRQLLARVAFYPYITVYYTYALIDDTVMYETMASWLAVHSATFLAVDFTYYCTCGTSRHPIASSNRVIQSRHRIASCSSGSLDPSYDKASIDCSIACTFCGPHTRCVTPAPPSMPSAPFGTWLSLTCCPLDARAHCCCVRYSPRLSCIEDVVSWMFYVPWALVIPPPVLVLHVHLNAFYQVRSITTHRLTQANRPC